MNARIGLPVLTLTTLVAMAPAQEKYWAAGSGGVKQIDTSGHLYQTVAPTSARDIAVAPDGKVWLPGSPITVLNADGSPFTTITPSAGISPYSIAFDKAGHAWVTGSSGGVEEFDAAGTSLGTITLPSGAPRCICVDADGNKWIAHRIGPPGVLSRIDAVTRAVSTHPLPAGSLILPIGVYADSRGLLNSSHIWTVGDNRGAGEVVEFDSTGTVVSTVVISPSARMQWLHGDCDASGITRTMWVGDWGNGDLHKIDVTTGLFTTYSLAPGNGVGGVTFDGFGGLWITVRGLGNVRRVDAATGGIEIDAAVGASNQISTRFQYACVVDQIGDLDQDGTPNLFEVMGGSSPFDPCSLPNASLSTNGSMALGGNLVLDVMADPTALSLVAFSLGTASPSLPIPGFGCAVQIDPTSILNTLIAIGPTPFNLAIPNLPGLSGFRLLTQGVNGAVPTFTNVAPIRIY